MFSPPYFFGAVAFGIAIGVSVSFYFTGASVTTLENDAAMIAKLEVGDFPTASLRGIIETIDPAHGIIVLRAQSPYAPDETLHLRLVAEDNIRVLGVLRGDGTLSDLAPGDRVLINIVRKSGVLTPSWIKKT